MIDVCLIVCCLVGKKRHCRKYQTKTASRNDETAEVFETADWEENFWDKTFFKFSRHERKRKQTRESTLES